jgi:hypothetical protein
MKKILTILALLMIFASTLPASTVPVDKDVGVSCALITEDEPSLIQVGVENMAFISVIDQAEYIPGGDLFKPEDSYLERTTLTGFNHLPPIYRIESFIDTSTYLQNEGSNCYIRVGAHSSGGISY